MFGYPRRRCADARLIDQVANSSVCEHSVVAKRRLHFTLRVHMHEWLCVDTVRHHIFLLRVTHLLGTHGQRQRLRCVILHTRGLEFDSGSAQEAFGDCVQLSSCLCSLVRL